jgi:hypothetical protein
LDVQKNRIMKGTAAIGSPAVQDELPLPVGWPAEQSDPTGDKNKLANVTLTGFFLVVSVFQVFLP